MPPPTADAEHLNPERVVMLQDLAECELEPTPPPYIKDELVVTGANGAPLGDLSARLARVKSGKENFKANDAANHVRVPLQTWFSIATTPTMESAPLSTASASLKRSGESTEQPDVKRRATGEDESSVPSVDVDRLWHLLTTRTFYLTLICEKRKNKPSQTTVHILEISATGVLQLQAVAKCAGIPTLSLPPSRPDGSVRYETKGALLEDTWPDLSYHSKFSYARQLRKIVADMRKPDKSRGGRLGSIHSGPFALMLDRRSTGTNWAVESEPTERHFVSFLLSSFNRNVPSAVGSTLASQMGRKSDLALTHGDLSPRNIIVCKGKIVAILGWDVAGWYPDWWEYVKFFDAPTSQKNADWYKFAGDIFAQEYAVELAAYQAMLNYQVP